MILHDTYGNFVNVTDVDKAVFPSVCITTLTGVFLDAEQVAILIEDLQMKLKEMKR